MNTVLSEYSDCPIRQVISHFGDKWSLLVLYSLHAHGTLRFGALHRHMSDISPKMLTSTLRRLEEQRLIAREVYPEVPPRVEYSLTPVGESLLPHLLALMEWAKEYLRG